MSIYGGSGKVMAIFILVLLLSGFAGCTCHSTSVTKTQATTTPATTTTPPSGISTGTPKVTITSPTDGAVVPAGNIAITVEVSGFTVVNKLGGTNGAGEGHLHYYKDVPAPTYAYAAAFTAPGTYVDTTAFKYVWPNITPGTHILTVQLVNNDHSPLIPLVIAKVTITVQ